MRQRKRIAIVDRQTEYSLRMAEWIQLHYKDLIMCFVLREIDELQDLVSRQSIDMIVIDGFYKEIFDLQFKESDSVCDVSVKKSMSYLSNIKNQIWWLQEQPSSQKRDLYRYQSMVDLFEMLQLEYVQQVENDACFDATDNNEKITNIALIPVVDSVSLRRWAKDTYGCGFGQSMLWYICFGNDEEHDDFSEKMLYAVKMENENMLEELKILNATEKATVHPVRSPYDYRELGIDEVKWLLEWVNKKEYSSYVYVNVGLLKDEQIFQLFDEIWLLCDQENGDRIQSIQNFFESCNKHTIIKNIQKRLMSNCE